MIEIEIRAKVENIENIKDRLVSLGAKLIKEVKQIDRVFGHPSQLDQENKIVEGGFSARIRQVDDKQRLDFKEILRERGGIELSADLSAVEIGLKFLKRIGYEEAFVVAKKRKSYSYNEFIICLDNVEKLGNFIEIEKSIDSADDNEEEEIRKECLKLLNELSPGSQIDNRMYGDMMQELKNRGKYE